MRGRVDALAEDHDPRPPHALDAAMSGRAPGGDLMRTQDVLPTGRNIHGFDPFRIPSAFAVADGARQAARLLMRHGRGAPLPGTVAMVLWGTDNLKTEGGPIARVLWLMGARPRRQLRNARRRRADPARRARPAIDVLSISPASSATSSPSRPGSSPNQCRSRADEAPENSSASTPSPSRRRTAAASPTRRSASRQCRQRYGIASTASSTTVPGTTRTSSPTATCGGRVRLRRRRPPGAPGGGAREPPIDRRGGLPESRFDRARRDHRRPLFRHPRRHHPGRAPGARDDRERLYRRPDPRRRDGADARRAGQSRDPAGAQSKWYRPSSPGYEASARSRPMSPIPSAGRRRPARWPPGSTSSSPRPRPDRAMCDRLAELNPKSARSPTG